jgi:hypothetical protein
MINQLYHTWTALGGANINPQHIHEIHLQEQTVVIELQIVIEVPHFDLRTLTEEQWLAIKDEISPGVHGKDDHHWFIFRESISAPFGGSKPKLSINDSSMMRKRR